MSNASLKHKAKGKLNFVFYIGNVLTLISLLYLSTLSPTKALAHPMGNFSINHYSKIEVEENIIRLRYIIDMAEIPSFGERTDMDTNGDKEISPMSRGYIYLERYWN